MCSFGHMHVSVLHIIHMLCVILFFCHSITLYYSRSQLTQLEELHIVGNTLNTVTDVVLSLSSLKHSYMSRCHISSLHERFVCHMFILLLHNIIITTL